MRAEELHQVGSNHDAAIGAAESSYQETLKQSSVARSPLGLVPGEAQPGGDGEQTVASEKPSPDPPARQQGTSR